MATDPLRDKLSFLVGEQVNEGWSILLTALLICAVLCVTAGVLLLRLPLIFLLGVYILVLLTAAVFKWPHLGAWGYVAIQFIRPAEVWPALAPLRLELVLVALCSVAFLLHQTDGKSRLRPRFHPMHLLLLLLLFAGVASVPNAVEKTRAVTGTYELFKVIAGYFIIVCLINDEKQIKWLVWIFAICAIVQWQWLFRGYFSGATWYKMGIVRAVGATDTLRDPNAMASYLLSALPFLVFSFTQLPTKLKLLLPVVLGPYLFGITVTGSRSAYIAGPVMGLTYWLRSKRKLISAVVGVVTLALLWMLMGPDYHKRFMTMLRPSDTSYETGDYGSAQARLEVWSTGWQIFLDHPATGIGAQCFSWANRLYTGSGLQPHSVFIQTASELGILGILGFFGTVIYTFRCSTLLKRRLMQQKGQAPYSYSLCMAIDMSLLSLLLAGIFGHNMYRFTYYFLAALVVVCEQVLKKNTDDVSSPDGSTRAGKDSTPALVQ